MVPHVDVSDHVCISTCGATIDAVIEAARCCMSHQAHRASEGGIGGFGTGGFASSFLRVFGDMGFFFPVGNLAAPAGFAWLTACCLLGGRGHDGFGFSGAALLL